MNNTVLMIITTIIVAIILVAITFFSLRKKESKKFKKEINDLDIEKNQLINVEILSEMTKVKELVKTDNLQHKLDEWNKTFDYIKEEMLPQITEDITNVDFLVDKHDFKNAVKKMTNIELEIDRLKKKSNKLINEIKLITNSEERNRALITKLKVLYRELQAKFERSLKEYNEVEDSIRKEFSKIEKKFQKFEDAMDNNDYVEVEKIVIVIEAEINNLKEILEKVPNIILSANILIPGKIEEAKTHYSRMIRDGYPLDYLNVEYNLDEIDSKTKEIMKKTKKLDINLEETSIELKTMLDYFNELFKDFDKEKECKDTFKEGCKKFRIKLEKVNKVVYDIYVQIDDIKVTYDLTEKEINRFSDLNKNLEIINEDFKRLLEESKTKNYAYSKLNDELDGLVLKLSRLQDDLDFELRSITSMKDDEYRAKEQLKTIQNLLKEAKYKLDDYKLPVIPSNYFIELKEAQDAIKEIAKELEKKPIVIKILNIRVDTARDLVFKIYNKTNDMIKSSMMSEKMIIYGNRYRSTYPEVEQNLELATTLFYKGQYDKSLNLSLESIEKIEGNKHNKSK
ncbi:MAG: septation ring formation regulator EzrA [Bacilli bacterium]|nr:septation ring formation regulator EzrA [Bacilli bacterium]